MKETIKRLKIMVDRATKYNYPEDSNMGISISDIRAVLEFCERHKVENEPQNAPGITPEWDKIDKRYNWVAIDEGGDEFAFIRRPTKMQNMVNGISGWKGKRAIFTGRYIDMANVDWTKTLSKRPAK